MKQQRSRLSSVLDAIKLIAELENTTQVKIAALSLQLVSNTSVNRQFSQVSKQIAFDNFPGQLSNIAKKVIDIDKSLFFPDLLEIGKIKYTQMCQILPSLVKFNFLLTIKL